MLKRILTIAIMSMLVVSSAYALTGVEGCPDGDANAFRIDGDNLPEQNICIGRVELSDMGEFDATGNFTYYQSFINDFDQWGNNANPNWQEDYAPRNPQPAGVTVSDSRMDYRQFADGSTDTQIAVILRETLGSYEMPFLWKVTGPNGEESEYYIGYFDNAEGCEDFDLGMCGPTGNDCEQMPEFCFFDNVGDNSSPNPEEYTGTWMWYPGTGFDDPNVEDGTPMCNMNPGQSCGNAWDMDNNVMNYAFLMPCVETQLCENVEIIQDPCCDAPQRIQFEDIDLGGSFVDADRMGDITWTEQGLSASMDKIDFMEMYAVDYDNDREVQNWVMDQYPPWIATDHYYMFHGIKPDLGPNTFTLQYDDKTVNLNFNVVNTEPMPVVPATTSNMVEQVVKSKSGKTIKGLSGQEVEVITPNIIVRELQGALVVQWAEPDLALFPDGFANHIELRMHVGRPYIGVDVSEGPSLWVAAPYQTGTIVVPADAYSFIKNEIKTRYPADTELYIQFQYRFKYFTDGTSGSTQNRGYGDGIRIPLN